MLTSDSDPIEVWLVTNNEPAPKAEANSADRLQLPLPPQPPHQAAAPMLHPSAVAPNPLLSTPSPRTQTSPFFKADPDGEGQSRPLPCMVFLSCKILAHGPMSRGIMPFVPSCLKMYPSADIAGTHRRISGTWFH